mmetsp:Transcript_18954/g.43989  ORF Transcript_18954/g.43989 Transcript_18954/m.43989 type:complete len:391 (-) Transcript_18954:290-1462(-)
MVHVHRVHVLLGVLEDAGDQLPEVDLSQSRLEQQVPPFDPEAFQHQRGLVVAIVFVILLPEFLSFRPIVVDVVGFVGRSPLGGHPPPVRFEKCTEAATNPIGIPVPATVDITVAVCGTPATGRWPAVADPASPPDFSVAPPGEGRFSDVVVRLGRPVVLPPLAVGVGHPPLPPGGEKRQGPVRVVAGGGRTAVIGVEVIRSGEGGPGGFGRNHGHAGLTDAGRRCRRRRRRRRHRSLPTTKRRHRHHPRATTTTMTTTTTKSRNRQRCRPRWRKRTSTANRRRWSRPSSRTTDRRCRRKRRPVPPPPTTTTVRRILFLPAAAASSSPPPTTTKTLPPFRRSTASRETPGPPCTATRRTTLAIRGRATGSPASSRAASCSWERSSSTENAF